MKLGDVCKFINGDRGKNYPSQHDISNNGEVPFINAGHIVEGNIDLSAMNYISLEKYTQLNSGKIKENDILYCLRGSLGKKALVRNISVGAIASSLVIIRPDTEKADSEYLFYALESPTVQKQMLQANNGSSQPNLSAKSVSEYEFLLPNIKAQREVVAKMQHVNRLIVCRKKQLSKLDELVKARFVELFGEPMTNSKGHILKKYGDLFELNAGGTPSKQKSEYWDNGTISWIGSNMCQNTVIYENDGNYITEEGLKYSSARMFPIDTVLIALVGATIGKTALLKFETTTNQNVLGVRGIRENGYTPEFIFYYTQGLYQKFLNIGDGGFAMASKGFISELPVPVVDLALQEQFSAFVEQTDKSKLEVQKSLEKLELLKKALMQKYFG